MKNIVKNWYLFIPTILLLIAICDLDYGYYQILRIIITIFAIVFALWFKGLENIKLMIAMIIIAILFNPILPIYLDKNVWVFLDLFSSIIFLISAISIIRNHSVNNNN
ncbi:MAG: hypothetical protein PHY39_06475 [Endomicrobiaceae bacterium]|nr:hypothetical protein [Endomicrobiaceae bacterium]